MQESQQIKSLIVLQSTRNSGPLSPSVDTHAMYSWPNRQVVLSVSIYGDFSTCLTCWWRGQHCHCDALTAPRICCHEMRCKQTPEHRIGRAVGTETMSHRGYTQLLKKTRAHFLLIKKVIDV